MRNVPLKNIAQSLGIHLQSLAQISDYQIDSRKTSPDTLFFALPGEKSDGHLYLPQVRALGGLAAVVSTSYQGPSHGLTLLPVPDVLASLHHLARLAVSASRATIIGITGSMGKTTTKDFTATLLEKRYKVGKTFSSYNTKLTLPITILNMDGDEDVWVLEMGMGEPGDIARLVDIASPDLAIMTKIGLAHYGALFPTVADIARAKAEIFSQPRTKKVIVDTEFPLPISLPTVTFSLCDSAADYYLHENTIDERGLRASELNIPFPQPHVRYNFLAALTAARTLHLDWSEIESQIPQLKLPKMRLEQVEKEGILFINDAYNANPESMKAALSCLPAPKSGGKRIAVLGRMRDLGPFCRASHEEVGRFAQNYVDCVLTYADEAKPLSEAFSEKGLSEHFVDLVKLMERLKELARPGDVVLLKGSRDLELERVLS